MDEHTSVSPPPKEAVPEIINGLIRGTMPLEVALAAWRERHGLRLRDVSALIGRQPSAVSAMLHDPARSPGVRTEVARLIGYEERGGDHG